MSDEQDKTYGSLGALAPNWDGGDDSGAGARNIDADEIYERFFNWVADVSPGPIRRRPSSTSWPVIT